MALNEIPKKWTFYLLLDLGVEAQLEMEEERYEHCEVSIGA